MRYPPLVLCFTKTRLCDTPCCNISRDTCAIPHNNMLERVLRYTIATNIAQYEKYSFWASKAVKTADLRRKPQTFGGNRRKQHSTLCSSPSSLLSRFKSRATLNHVIEIECSSSPKLPVEMSNRQERRPKGPQPPSP